MSGGSWKNGGIAGFDMGGGVELTMIHTYIDVQKCDFGGCGVPSELHWIATICHSSLLYANHFCP